MLTAEKIRELLAALNEELGARDVVGEIGLCGGAVMCLVFQARPATKDVDGIFEPTREIRAAAAAVRPVEVRMAMKLQTRICPLTYCPRIRSIVSATPMAASA